MDPCDYFENVTGTLLQLFGSREFKQRGRALRRTAALQRVPDRRGVDALDYYERAITVDPSKPAYWSNKVAALMAQGCLLDAIVDTAGRPSGWTPPFAMSATGSTHSTTGRATGHGDRAAK